MMFNTAQSLSRFSASTPSSLPSPMLIDSEAPAAVGISAAWRKLITQAEMAAPHLQVATIEGEPGSGKQTLARLLFSRSPHTSEAFRRRDAREWLATDADPGTLSVFLYLDRVDLLATPGQGLLLSVLKAPGPSGRASNPGPNSPPPDGRSGCSHPRPRLPSHCHPFRCSAAPPATRRYRPAHPILS